MLDVIHRLIGQTDRSFFMTGTSAGKSKYDRENLLAGRVLVYHFYPLTYDELGDVFDLGEVL